MKLDHKGLEELGVQDHRMVPSGSIVRYVAGVVSRERQRMAEVFRRNGMESIAAEIMDDSMDREVFKWKSI